MKQKNQRNQKRKLNSLVLLVAFTAIMLIVSTYAWFSINTEVRLTNLTGEVKAVEGLQISLDAKSWTDTIDLSGVDLTNATQTYTGHINKKPSAEGLKPVSTTGTVGENMTDLTMYTGTHDGKTKLESIAAATDGYYAFDVFVMNASKTDTADTLQLNTDTLFKLATQAKESSGLQNTVRVGIAKYGDVAALTADQEAVINATTKTSKISDVAIWEPNANAHIAGIVGNNNKLTLSTDDITTWMKNPESGKETVDNGTGKVKFGTARALPTYALTSTAVGKTINDIYDWKDVSNGYLAMQNTLQTSATNAALTQVYNLKSTSSGNFTIAANAITRLRVFLWLEGQDVDCTNYASHGGTLTLSLGFCKGVTENLGNN